MLDQGMKFTLHKLHCIPYKKELERVDSRFLAAASLLFSPHCCCSGRGVCWLLPGRKTLEAKRETKLMLAAYRWWRWLWLRLRFEIGLGLRLKLNLGPSWPTNGCCRLIIMRATNCELPAIGDSRWRWRYG